VRYAAQTDRHGPKDISCPWGLFPNSRLSTITRTGSADFFQKAKEFVDHCTAKHLCWNPNEAPRLPSRVLDIGHQDDQIRLLETKGKQGQYVCLSHCWGDHQPIRTTLASLPHHLASLPFNHLPKSYQTAVGFARYFGIRYVWIDSLCIIQDDQDDWVRESAQMCEIYEKSFLTIAATSAPNCSFDLFAAEPREVASMAGEYSTTHAYHVLACNVIAHPGLESTHDDIVMTWPLLDRAWVLQERLLSPRVLHISRPEIIWECRAQTLCECGVMDTDSHQSGNTQRHFRGPYSKVSHYEILQQKEKDSLVRTWHDIVQWYTKLSIKYDSDRLPALSGLARQMASKRPGIKYLAGLWEDSLCLDLLWMLHLKAEHSNATTSIYSSAVRAPSWSWAACHRAIIFPLSNLNDNTADNISGQLEEVYPHSLSARCELATSDPTGKVRSGTLTITGRVFEGFISGQSETWHAYPSLEPYTWRLQVHLPSTGNNTEILPQIPYFERFGQLHLDNEGEYRDSSSRPDKGRVVCVPIARVGQRKTMEVRETNYALMLRPRSNSETEYERVGILLELRDSGQQRHWDNPSEMWAAKPSSLEILGVVRTIKIV
jgi:hypothetical protein